jgi:hypothetical protein
MGGIRGLIRKVGRRGATLLFLGSLDGIYSFSLLNPPHDPTANPTLAFLATIAPLWAWAILWGAVGLICLIGAFSTRDRFAFAAAIGIKVLFGLTFALAAFAGLERAYVSAAVWLAFAAFIAVIAGWPEDIRTAPRPPGA